MIAYRIVGNGVVVSNARVRSPYFLLRDHEGIEASAVLAGMVKGTHEELRTLIATIARLTSVIAPQQEVRARELLEMLIDAKRAYVQSEAKRKE
jgi:hypothetical protein